MEKIIESGAVVFDGCTFTNVKVVTQTSPIKKELIELEVIELASEDFVNEPKRYPHEGVFLVKTPNGKLIVKVGHDFEGNSEVSEPIPIY